MMLLVTVLALSCLSAIAEEAASVEKPSTPPIVLPKGPADPGRFVLIELFSSEGCSSCPGADAMINIIAREARDKGLPVYTLAFHVDYWDQLKTPHGIWKDPFSSPPFTARQKTYNLRMQGPNPYKGKVVTPQVIVNGRMSTQKPKQRFPEYIQSLLDIDRACQIHPTIKPTKSGYQVTWTIDNLPEGSNLYYALVEDKRVSEVTAGENHGKTLEHEGVVRLLYEFADPANNNEGRFPMPKNVQKENARVILFVQDPRDMTVHAATSVDLPKDQKNVNEKAANGFGFHLVDLPGDGHATTKTNCTPSGVCIVPDSLPPTPPARGTDQAGQGQVR